MINVGYKIHDHAIDLPKIDYQTIGAAGLDLYAANSEKISLSTLERYAIPCLLYTSPSPRDRYISRMPSSA